MPIEKAAWSYETGCVKIRFDFISFGVGGIRLDLSGFAWLV
jgi:hypothetical protein